MTAMGISPQQRQQLAALLEPDLANRQSVSLPQARELLEVLARPLGLCIDGMETAHVLRRCGFEKDYSRPVAPSVYRRKAA